MNRQLHIDRNCVGPRKCRGLVRKHSDSAVVVLTSAFIAWTF